MEVQKVKRRPGPPKKEGPKIRHTDVVSISMPKELAAFMREYAQASDQPISRVVVDLLQTCRPALQDVLEALRVVQSGPEQAQQILNRTLSKAAQDLSSLQGRLDLAAARKGGCSDAPKM